MTKLNKKFACMKIHTLTFHDDFDVLTLLYKLSCKLLATPASTAASERTFSMARNLISEKRSIATNRDCKFELKPDFLKYFTSIMHLLQSSERSGVSFIDFSTVLFSK